MQCCETINCSDQGTICIPKSDLPRIVIVGGGFAGLNLVKKLKNKPVQIVLIDKNNHHQFLPLLYQVATSGIEPDSIVFPFRKLFKHYPNVIFRMAEAVRVEPEQNQLTTSIGTIAYDYLVLAGGSETNYFGNKDFKHFGQGLKTTIDALDLRSRLLQNLERAAVTCVKEDKEALSSVVVIGGGATGVEIAGALAEFKRYILPQDYPELGNIEMKIYLIEAADRLLQGMPTRLSEKTRKYLGEMKVDVLLNNTVSSYDGTKLLLGNGHSIRAENFIWTAGVCGRPLDGIPDQAIGRQKRILVDNYNRIPPLKNVFAIGDLASMKTTSYPNGHPMVAQVAIQQGKMLAYNLLQIINNKSLLPFAYRDKGSMATIGKKKAVARIGRLQSGGFFAWLIWSFIHLISIIGVRNKLLIAINWLWSYFSYDKGNRVIIRKYISYLDRLRKYLVDKEKIVFVLGYSFGDDHINDVIVNGLNSNHRLSLIALAYDEDTFNKGVGLLGNYPNFSVYTEKKKYSNRRENTFDSTSNIGDFKNFITLIDEVTFTKPLSTDPKTTSAT